MSRRNPALSNTRWQLGHPEFVSKRGTEKSDDLERKYFDFDRKIVALALNTLRGAVNQGATQMEMVADERMFEKSLSGTFSRAAHHLDQMERTLGKLLNDVASATGYPRIAAASPLGRAVVRRLPVRQV
jgi:hypothetical protein